jgi:hypothetical protein
MEVNAVTDGNGAPDPNAGCVNQYTTEQAHLSSNQLPTAAAPLSLFQILQTDNAKHLDEILDAKNRSPVLHDLGSPENTLRFMRASLRSSYLFGREVVPSYLANVFNSLTNYAPASDTVGHMLRGLSEMCIGELCTNNIYERPRESHAHFHDLYEAYADAGGNIEEFQRFIDSAEYRSTLSAIRACSDLWSKGSMKYAERLLTVCHDPLASFILMPCNEIQSTVIYPVALAHISSEPQFAKFRRFMEVHIQLDGDSHGSVALDWLALHIEQAKVSRDDLDIATKKIIGVYQGD